MTSMMLARDERVRLAGVLSRFIDWNPAAVVRVLTTERAVGLYADAPMGVLAFVALPLSAPPPERVDRAVSAHRLRDILGDVSATAAATGAVEVRLPDARDMPPVLAALPSREGWIPAERATASEVSTALNSAMADYLTEAKSASDAQADEAFKQAIAERWWARPSWGGLPLAALHAAQALGFLAHPGVRVSSATRAGWKRMQTPAGQIFVAPPESYAGIPLSVVR
jgi:hypothetical protein